MATFRQPPANRPFLVPPLPVGMRSAQSDDVASTSAPRNPKTRYLKSEAASLQRPWCMLLSVPTDKRIPAEISSMRLNEGRGETPFLNGGPGPAAQLNKDDVLPLRYVVGGRGCEGPELFILCLDQVTD